MKYQKFSFNFALYKQGKKKHMHFPVLQGLDDEVVKSAALDVFSFILEHNPSSVRAFILQESHHQDDVRFCLLVFSSLYDT